MVTQTIALAQSQQPASRPARDSAFSARVVERGDSSGIPWSGIGRIASDTSIGTTIIDKTDLRRVQYSQLADALARTTPWNQLSHGGFAQHDGLSVLGGRNVDLSVGSNGRALVDPWSGQYQLVQAQPASLDRIELLLGTDAVGRASSMSLSEVNLTTITHNAATPFTSLWYHQGGGDLVAVDGTLSQNVAQGVNVALGVRRSGARGSFPGTDFDMWSVRAAVRWTLSPLTHALVTYQLSSLNTELWGGLTTSSMSTSILDLSTTPVFSTLRDETRRHDVSAHLAHMLAADSTSVLRATAYASVSSLLRLRDSTMFVDPSDSLVGLGMSGQTYGLQVRLDQRFAGMQLHAGGSIDAQSLDGRTYISGYTATTPQLFTHLQMPLASWMTMRVAARMRIERGHVLTGAGVSAESNLGSVILLADLSTSSRIATPGEGGALNPERHVLAMLRASGATTTLRWSVTGFSRIITDPILTQAVRTTGDGIATTVSQQGGRRSILGVVGSATLRLGPLEVIPTVRAQTSTGDASGAGSDVPACMADLSVGYVFDAGFSTVTLGVRSTIVTRHWAPQFVPLTWTYVRPLNEAPLQFDGLNIFLSARVGNATVRASYENILGQRWYTTSLAPEIARSIRLSVDWSFLD